MLVTDDPCTRIGITNPSTESLLTVSCTFAGYHAVRRQATQEGIPFKTLSSQQVRRYRHIFADYFMVAAAEVQLHCIGRTSLARLDDV